MHWIEKIMILLGVLVITIVPAFLALVMLALSDNMHWIYFLTATAILLYILLALKLFNVLTTKKRKQFFASFSALVLIATAIHPLTKVYDNLIPTVNAEVDIYQYEPFTKNNLKKMDDQPSIQLQEPLPIMDGATALYPYYAALAQAIYPQKQYDPYDSEVMVNQTDGAYDNLIQGKVDLIFAAGPSDRQISVAQARGIEFELIPIGREAFVFFVHTDNPVSGLTVQQIQNIYAGNITNWQQVGGEDKAIRAFQRPEDSGSQTALQRLMGDIPIMEAPTEDIASGMGGIIQEVATYKNYPNAIGYTFRYFANEMVKNKKIKLLELNGVAPTKNTIRNGSYPIASEFFIVTTKNRNEQTNQIIDWVLSDEGQSLLEKAGYVPLVE